MPGRGDGFEPCEMTRRRSPSAGAGRTWPRSKFLHKRNRRTTRFTISSSSAARGARGSRAGPPGSASTRCAAPQRHDGRPLGLHRRGTRRHRNREAESRLRVRLPWRQMRLRGLRGRDVPGRRLRVPRVHATDVRRCARGARGGGVRTRRRGRPLAGGACVFRRSVDPQCKGGGSRAGVRRADCAPRRDARPRRCQFFDQASTLGPGYCDGGNCVVQGRKWPSKLSNMLSY